MQTWTSIELIKPMRLYFKGLPESAAWVTIGTKKHTVSVWYREAESITIPYPETKKLSLEMSASQVLAFLGQYFEIPELITSLSLILVMNAPPILRTTSLPVKVGTLPPQKALTTLKIGME